MYCIDHQKETLYEESYSGVIFHPNVKELAQQIRVHHHFMLSVKAHGSFVQECISCHFL